MTAIGDNLFLSALPLSSPTRPTLSVLQPPLENYEELVPPPEHHLFIPLSDTPDASLLLQLPAALRFIYRHRHQQDGVLIHCFHGTSRSVSIALAYRLLTRERDEDTLPELLVHMELARLQAVYPSASPSPYFVRQLYAVAQRSPQEPALYSFPPENGDILPLEAAELLRIVSTHGTVFTQILLRHEREDIPCAARCARCRMPLLPSGACLQTPVTNGCVQTLPVMWMRRCIVDTTGRLRCVCGARVGRYDLSGELAQFWVQDRALDWQL
ncbi:Dual specificity protein phosphatase 12 [Gracilariopsis chorda]|uniref:protein-tyrosine-phosphatase n=1 Tax=Gracilariopsis chorda TaxID=448386 RepID=A0A2V3IRB6_9FLOR|nr:Dual specificity protein phosphatase 12 [Gracilariopsis chorda]|eukprot:PXF44658.1 Dual specificity protein phosphatase 12 [Gracilariopsis chorda]